MSPRAVGPVIVFAVGFLGWLAAGMLGVTGYLLWVWAATVGIIGALAYPRLIAVPALWLGILASYPAALALGLISFLGENWAVFAALLLVLATLAFSTATLLIRASAARRSVP